MCLCWTLGAEGRSRVLSPNVQSLQVVVGQDFLSPPVMRLGSDDVLHVSFDELSHQYHRYVYHVELCNADWQPNSSAFDNDYLQGFNDNPIEDYQNSEGTNQLYTHYRLQLPNERCRLTQSGNYRLHILDDDNGQEEVAVAEFYVVSRQVLIGLSVSSNTDIENDRSAQQVSMSVRYQHLRVSRPDEQIRTVVRQNDCEWSERRDVPPSFTNGQGLSWEHNRGLIFPGGNEYHKFEMLDVDHPTMGIERIGWDGSFYHAYPVECEPRRNYVYDEDADGAFYIRNSDNIGNDTQSDYLQVHYKLLTRQAEPFAGADVIVDGQWTTAAADNYVARWDPADQSYNAVVLQKQGYYNYQFLLRDVDGTVHLLPQEGNFYQTENRYQAFVYYREQSGRFWHLVGYQQVVFKK